MIVKREPTADQIQDIRDRVRAHAQDAGRGEISVYRPSRRLVLELVSSSSRPARPCGPEARPGRGRVRCPLLSPRAGEGRRSSGDRLKDDHRHPQVEKRDRHRPHRRGGAGPGPARPLRAVQPRQGCRRKEAAHLQRQQALQGEEPGGEQEDVHVLHRAAGEVRRRQVPLAEFLR